MFDIGFWELSVIGVVALIVIGPERLPGVARTAGMWFGRMRRFVSTVKADIDREIKADELKRVMQEQAQSSGLHEIIEETKQAADSLDQPAEYPAEYLVKSDSNANAVDEADASKPKQQDHADKP